MSTTYNLMKVYSWPTPNGHKVHIMMEECGFKHGTDWRAIAVDIGAGDQFKEDFLAISPNNKIPALVDPNGPDGKPIALFESGAILLYLAAKTGQFLPESDREKYEVLQWLMFQMASVGPMMGQANHFGSNAAPERIEYAINRYRNEVRRLHGVMEHQLSTAKWIAGSNYSIADQTTTANITPKALTLTGLTANNKVYNTSHRKNNHSDNSFLWFWNTYKLG